MGRQVREVRESTPAAAGNKGNIISPNKSIRTGGTWFSKYGNKPFSDSRTDDATVKYGRIEWDVAPKQEYFDELFRVSRNQIIWGGNYFSLPPTRCFVVWRKLSISERFSMAMAEYAWTSFNRNALVFEHTPQRGKHSGKFHPTEKPVVLYQWLLRHFANEGDRILDTHMGSQASRLAAWSMGYDYVGCEIDEYYFKRGCEFFDRETQGVQAVGGGGRTVQLSLFQ